MQAASSQRQQSCTKVPPLPQLNVQSNCAHEDCLCAHGLDQDVLQELPWPNLFLKRLHTVCTTLGMPPLNLPCVKSLGALLNLGRHHDGVHMRIDVAA